MAHSHAHSHGEPENTYFLDQLCTIAVCGLLGFVAVMGYRTGLLANIKLHPDFRIPVFIAGSALLVMVVLRALAVWRAAGAARGGAQADHAEEHAHEHHGHEHSHGANEACGHEHGHSEESAREHAHGHEHSHGEQAHGHHHGHEHSHAHDAAHSHGDDAHDHGWAPWRYAVLLLPVVLYFLGLPSAGENLTRRDRNLAFKDLEPGMAARRFALANVAGCPILFVKRQGDASRLKFTDLTVYAGREKSRDFFEGRTVILTGQFMPKPGKDKEFKLYREKVTCCGNDAIYLQAMIVAPEPISGLMSGEWVEITGELSFQKLAGENQWLPVIELPSNSEIKRTDARDPFGDV